MRRRSDLDSLWDMLCSDLSTDLLLGGLALLFLVVAAPQLALNLAIVVSCVGGGLILMLTAIFIGHIIKEKF